MTPPITATRTRTTGACVACLLGQSHTEHDTTLPVATRTSITAPARAIPDPDIPGYGETDHWPAV